MAVYTYQNVGTNQVVHLHGPDFDGNPLWELISGPGGSGGVSQAELDAVEQDTTGPHGISDFAELVTDDEANAKVIAHALATDPHGDRAYTDDKADLLIPLSQKGTANGVATLDVTAKLAAAQLPAIPASAVTSGTVAVARLPVGTTAGTVAAGDDPRFAASAASQGHRAVIFYAPPQIVNGTNTNEGAAAVFAKFDQIVFGAGSADPGDVYYASTVAIIARIKELNTRAKVFGYVDMGITAPSLAAMKTSVDQWVTAGADGILFDTVEFGYGVTRSKMNEMVTYCHDHSLITIINGFNPDDVMGSAVVATYNPTGTPTALDERDYYLLESWIVNDSFYSATDGFATMAALKAKGDLCRAYRASLGVKLMATGVVDYSTSTAGELDLFWGMHQAACLVWGIDSYGISPTNYSASGANVGVVRDFGYWPDLDDRFNASAEYAINAAGTEATRSDLGVVFHDDTVTSTYSFTLPALSYHVLPVGTTAGTVAAGDVTTAALATKVAKGALLYNVKDYGAIGDNTATDTPAITAAIAAAVSAGGGTVYFPPGIYKTTTALSLSPHLVIRGAGGTASRINNATSDMFTSSVAVHHLVVEDLYLTSGASAGHIFAPGTNGVYQSVFQRLTLLQSNTAKSVYKSNSAVGTNTFIDNVVASCDITGTLTHTVPLWECVSSGGNANRNLFLNNRVTNTGNFAFWLEEQLAGSYAYDNVFMAINFERCNGGHIKILGGNSTLIQDCPAWDLTTTTNDLYYIGKSVAGSASRFTSFKQVNRRGGTLGGGLVDVRLQGSNSSPLVLFEQMASSTAGLTIDVGSNSGVKFVNCHASSTVQNPGTGFAGSNTVADSAIAGVVSDTAGSGSPEGVITAPIGSRYLRTDGGAGSTFYIKESGTGNTGWSAATTSSAAGYDLQVFTTSGTWTKPAWVTANTTTGVVCIAAGSGGGSGRRGAAGTVRCGGGGGGGSGMSTAEIVTSTLGATAAVTVGTAGAGGAAVATDDTNGADGGAGGNTTFSTFVLAGINSTGGGGGTATAGTAGAAGTGNAGANTAGGAASGTGGVGVAASSATGVSGGGSGGGITTGDVASNGGAGGRNIAANNVAATGGLVDSTAPGAGYAQPASSGLPGNGGAGGASSITTNAQTGGAGGRYGAGGGGGGASLNTHASGAGAAGGAGICVVITRGL